MEGIICVLYLFANRFRSPLLEKEDAREDKLRYESIKENSGVKTVIARFHCILENPNGLIGRHRLVSPLWRRVDVNESLPKSSNNDVSSGFIIVFSF